MVPIANAAKRVWTVEWRVWTVKSEGQCRVWRMDSRVEGVECVEC